MKLRQKQEDGLTGNCHCYVYTSVIFISHMLSLNNIALCLVINKPCVRRTGYMRLISWIHHCGSEQISCRAFSERAVQYIYTYSFLKGLTLKSDMSYYHWNNYINTMMRRTLDCFCTCFSCFLENSKNQILQRNWVILVGKWQELLATI